MTVGETTKHLSAVLGEEVHKKDIYRLALDGHLVLSINFINHAYAKLGELVGFEGVTWYTSELGEFLRSLYKDLNIPDKVMRSLNLDDERFINLDSAVRSIRGVWDLLMVGGERLDIEHLYQFELGGPGVTLTYLDGSFVHRGDQVAQIQESFDDNEFQDGSDAQKKKMEEMITREQIPLDQAEKMRSAFNADRNKYLDKKSKGKREDDYFPAGGLPDDALLVVKTTEIMNFLLSLDSSGSQKEKPLRSKERNTLLVMIAALCREIGIDYSQKGVTSAIEMITDKHGTPISDDTIRKVLKQLDDAVSARSK